ncbi:MAG TPA: hypothetical protein VEV83_05020 [Parafilimonas sp.]|nr:hypothetical protein [Parafilimonas sp.]
MQFSDDNFDDLVQKAAEEYPLRTDNSNWDVISVRLNTNGFHQKPIQNRKWPYAAVLLLLLGGVLFTIVEYSGNSSTANQNAGVQKAADQKNTTNATTNRPEGNKPDVAGVQISKANSVNPSVASEAVPGTRISKADPSGNGNVAYDFNSFVATPEQQTDAVQSEALTETRVPQSNQSSLKPESANQDVQNSIASTTPVTTNANAATTKNEKASTTIPITLKTQPKTLYGRFFAGPQLSTVKFQQTDKVGYRIGVAVGYRLNNRFSLELGMQREKKNFFSDGKYFDRSSLRLKESTAIESLHGSSVLTDIPISLRYNLNAKGKGQFFATAGLSGVLITHTERYDYAVTKDGIPDNLSRSYSSAETTKYFSTANMSVGYETPLSKSLKLQVEPYYQVHLQGFGIGDLPLNSFGINLGVVKGFK